MIKSIVKSIFLIVIISFASCGGGESNNADSKETSAQESKEENSGTEKETQKEETQKEETTETSKPDDENYKKAEQAFNAIKKYYDGLSEGNYDKSASVFAEKINQWILKKDTDPKFVAEEAKRFLSTKSNVKYTMDASTFTFSDNKASVTVTQDWTGYHAKLVILLEFDDNSKVVSYKEGQIVNYKARKASAQNLEAYLANSKKLSFPIDIDPSTANTKLNQAQMNFLNLKVSDFYGPGADYYSSVGHFDLEGDKVGIVYLYKFEASASYTLEIFDKKTGKRITEQSIGTTSAGRGGANSGFKTKITEDGKIEVKSVWAYRFVSPESGDNVQESTSVFQITKEGSIQGK